MICNKAGIMQTIFLQREYNNNEMYIVYNNKLNFVIQLLKSSSNVHSINKTIKIFHKARNINRVKYYKNYV